MIIYMDIVQRFKIRKRPAALSPVNSPYVRLHVTKAKSLFLPNKHCQCFNSFDISLWIFSAVMMTHPPLVGVHFWIGETRKRRAAWMY